MNVVLVDDDTVVLKLLAALLGEFPNCTGTRAFTKSAEALRWCGENDCDLVLVDSVMPQPNGTEFIRHFRTLQGKEYIPVIMITGELDRTTRIDALRAGANDFLTKPLDMTEFTARTRNMLALRQGQRELAERVDVLTDEVHDKSIESRARELEIIVRLSRAAEYRKGEPGGHLIRLGLLSKLVGQTQGLSSEEQDLLLRAAPLHDIGKIAIPDSILHKPSSLSPEEWEVVKDHSAFGYQILKGSDSRLLQVASIIALTHHERFDGTGYPEGLKGKAIPLFGRIVGMVDCFDSLLSARPQRPAWDESRVLEFMRDSAGTLFDPECVDALLKGWDEALMIRSRVRDELWPQTEWAAGQRGWMRFMESLPDDLFKSSIPQEGLLRSCQPSGAWTKREG